MAIHITKTAKQAQMERNSGENICPECGQWAIGIKVSELRWFTMREQKKFSCWKCGCHWETDWVKK